MMVTTFERQIEQSQRDIETLSHHRNEFCQDPGQFLFLLKHDKLPKLPTLQPISLVFDKRITKSINESYSRPLRNFAEIIWDRQAQTPTGLAPMLSGSNTLISQQLKESHNKIPRCDDISIKNNNFTAAALVNSSPQPSNASTTVTRASAII